MPKSNRSGSASISPTQETRRLKVAQYFRPWLADVTVLDLNPGSTTDYAATFASDAVGVCASQEEVARATRQFPETRFSAESIRDLRDGYEVTLGLGLPLEALSQVLPLATETAVFSFEDPKDPDAFASQVQALGRPFALLSQAPEWPYTLSDGLQEGASAWIIALGSRPLPQWPRLGLAMPTVDNAQQAEEAILSLGLDYPGEMVVALALNGSHASSRAQLEELAGKHPNSIVCVSLPTNRGYAQGCNAALLELQRRGDIELYGVVNDDVIAGPDCLPELAAAMLELDQMGLKPGLIGPVSNRVNGRQQVDIGQYGDLDEMRQAVRSYHRTRHSSAVQVAQLRGLLLLIHPDLLEAIGGFDPRFGVGNFEDDDLNLRTRLAGHTLWIAEGAFLHHYGSTTFKNLGVDYRANIERNQEAFQYKWDLLNLEDWPSVEHLPDSGTLYVPLDAALPEAHRVRVNGEWVDLVQQASDMEFAAWLYNQFRGRPRAYRERLIEAARSWEEIEAAA